MSSTWLGKKLDVFSFRHKRRRSTPSRKFKIWKFWKTFSRRKEHNQVEQNKNFFLRQTFSPFFATTGRQEIANILQSDFYSQPPEWPKFGEILKVFCNSLKVNLVFGQIWDLFWQILYANDQVFIDENVQILKNTREVWSHWAVVVAQLAARSLPKPEDPGSNPVIGNFYWTIIVNCL